MIVERARWISQDIVCECGDGPASDRYLLLDCKNEESMKKDADLEFRSIPRLWEGEARKIVDFIYELF